MARRLGRVRCARRWEGALVGEVEQELVVAALQFSAFQLAVARSNRASRDLRAASRREELLACARDRPRSFVCQAARSPRAHCSR